MVIAVLAPAQARGQTTSSLSWSRLPGAEECIGAPELARRVEERLGRQALVAPSRAEVSVEGRVGPGPGRGWRAAVALARPGGEVLSERVIETRERSCRALDDALVLVIALLIDPEGAPPPPPPEPEPRVIIREVVRTVRVPVAVREPWRMAAATGVEAEHGALPELGLAASLALAVDPPGVPPVELRGAASTESSADADLDGRAAHMRLVSAALAVCPGLRLGRARVAACGDVRLAWLRWRGEGFEVSRRGTLVVPALGAEARVAWPLMERIALVAGAGARVPLRRAEVSYELSPAVAGDPEGGEETLYRAAAVSVWVSAGVAVTIF